MDAKRVLAWRERASSRRSQGGNMLRLVSFLLLALCLVTQTGCEVVAPMLTPDGKGGAAPHTIQSSRPVSDPTLIERAYQKGKINEEQKYAYLIYAVFDYEKLPEEYRGNAAWDGTTVMLEINLIAGDPERLCRMSAETQAIFRRYVQGSAHCNP